MPFRLVPYRPEWEPAVARSNARLAASGKAPFLLPDRAPIPTAAPVSQSHWLAIEESTGASTEVRGGCRLQQQPGWLNGESIDVVNLQSPLSEGLFDRRLAGLGVWMLRDILRTHRYVYCVGMGGEEQPLPQLLRALGWRVEPVPFSFRVLAGRRFLAHLQPLRRDTRLGRMARLGAYVPLLPDLAIALAHAWRRAEPEAHGARKIVPVRDRLSFGADRTAEVFAALYPADDPRNARLSLGTATGVLRVSPFSSHPYFGGLTVATLAEALLSEDNARAFLRTAVDTARSSGADIVVANFSDPLVCSALQAEGWIPYRSNYLVGLSPSLAKSIGEQPYYLSRGDGDGLLNL